MTNLEAALKYLKMGLSVIPLVPSGKKPILASWAEYQKRLPTESEVRSWFTQMPLANIGVITGSVSQLAVLDADGPLGLKYLQENSLSSPVTVISGNGKHLWFKWTNGIRNSASEIADKVDIRGEGGYVVAPPSIHENGRRYRLLNPSSLTVEMPLFPSGLLTVGSAAKDTAKNEEGWIAEALKGMKHGNIDSTLFTVCSRLRADGYSRGDAVTLLQPHAERVGATPGHLEDKIDNVWSRYEPNRKPVIEAVSQETTDEKDESLENFLEADDRVEWFVPGLLAKSAIAFIVGLPETGKTWLAIDLAIEAARGGRWLGTFQTAKAKILFVDQERFRGETKRRFKAVIEGKGISSKALGDLEVKSGSTYKLDLDQSYAAFRKKLERTRPDLIIVDSFATFHTKEENNRKDIQEVLERIKALRNEFGCAFIFIHHENKLSYQSKEEGREPTLAEMAGNIAIPAAAETVLTVRKRTDGTSIVYHTKSTLARQHTPFEVKVSDLAGPEKIEVRGYL